MDGWDVQLPPHTDLPLTVVSLKDFGGDYVIASDENVLLIDFQDQK